MDATPKTVYASNESYLFYLAVRRALENMAKGIFEGEDYTVLMNQSLDLAQIEAEEILDGIKATSGTSSNLWLRIEAYFGSACSKLIKITAEYKDRADKDRADKDRVGREAIITTCATIITLLVYYCSNIAVKREALRQQEQELNAHTAQIYTLSKSVHCKT